VVPQPRTRNTCRLEHAHGLASSAFAHHYSRNHYCFLFLRVLRCFTSPRPHQPPYTFRRRRHPMTGARFPHSEIPGSKPGCRLPEAYRRLPRPSSAPDAKASTVCPQKLEHTRTIKRSKMLASTVQFSKNKQQPNPNKPETRRADLAPHQEENKPALRHPHRTPLGEVRYEKPEGFEGPFPQDPTVCPTSCNPPSGVPHPLPRTVGAVLAVLVRIPAG
jgi:hypothetical protein